MSLFGHLALKFGSHPENLATEALGYILARSERARLGLLSSLGAEAGPLDLSFETQFATDEQSRPDLAVFDAARVLRVLIEAKYWAGFTENQPVNYLQQLPTGGVLAVVCPEARTTYIWRELVKRLRAAGHVIEERALQTARQHALVDGKHLVLVSWRSALSAIRNELPDERELLADVEQLEGLCRRMDSEAFIPLTSKELTSNVYRRVHEFGRSVDDLAVTAIAEGIMNKKGGRASAANGWYGRYARLRGAFVLLHVSTWKWTALGPSPLWLTVFGSTWTAEPTAARQLLTAYEARRPGSVHLDYRGYATVKLDVPVGAERIEIIRSVIDQLHEIGEVVAPLGVGAADAPPPEPDADPVGRVTS